MQAHKCDRCGEFYVDSGFLIKDMDEIRIGQFNIEDRLLFIKRLDLCSSCGRTFQDLMEKFYRRRI
jgi:hypothetical protein